jgi:Formamidopyrimidine-DNA glycosylase
MIELPESQTLAKQLRETVCGKTIEKVVAASSPHGFAFYSNDPAEYPILMEGKTITDISASGGYVEILMGDLAFAFNDGVNIRLLKPETVPPKKHQMHIKFEDGYQLVGTVQMYGGLMIYQPKSYDNPYYLSAKEKPSPLTEGFDQAYFSAIVSAATPKLSAKGLLATEQRIPGLGNGCAHDILFTAGVNPQSHVHALPDSTLEKLFGAVKGKLMEMTELGGRNVEKDLFGNPGRYETILSAKTLPYPCPVCGGGLSRKAFLGGNIYVCLNCQPLIKNK